MNCLDDRRLLDLHYDTFTGDPAAHVAACPSCAARLRTLRQELTRIDLVLRTPAPRVATRIRLVRRWAPLAFVAAAMLAIVLHGMPRPAATHVAGDDDTVALADELANAMTGDVSLDDGTTDRTAQSTCTWGDPLLGVGCEEPAVMRIAWR